MKSAERYIRKSISWIYSLVIIGGYIRVGSIVDIITLKVMNLGQQKMNCCIFSNTYKILVFINFKINQETLLVIFIKLMKICIHYSKTWFFLVYA